ncbi:hypothetical protein QJS10_CPB19g01022 [Acorus calamus]|uniref:Uncharacterized protein n=1 Tax=Acorus calamus TaxID=4465 RepID=A0AAV9CIE6_ACOCL|nr:hypothetical protein QJS10_CPB19g01022 [Acorus calamus]
MWSFMESKENMNHQHQQMSFMAPSSSVQVNFIEGTGAYDLGELDKALLLYLEGQDQQQNSSSSAGINITPPTLNIFPSQPMHVHPPPKGGESVLKRPLEQSMEIGKSVAEHGRDVKVVVKRQGNNRMKGPTSSSEHEGPKTPDPKILRRLAQNREAARKSRLRKKAYVQQLENSRIKLTQMEQELQRARAQGVFYGGGAILGDQGLQPSFNGLSSDAAVFDMEYGRWLEEHHRLMCEMRGAVEEHLPENHLRVYVDKCLAHYDEMMRLKSAVIPSDIFHLISGVWKTPAERCFLWIGGFRPSHLLKVILSQIEPLSEQQIIGICSLQQSTQEAEEVLTQGMDALHRSLSDTIASYPDSSSSYMANYMDQMAIASTSSPQLKALSNKQTT